MAISPALLGISLILSRVKHGEGLLRRTSKHASLLRIACLIGRGKALREPWICLPARSRFGKGGALFEQPGKEDFFSGLLVWGWMKRTKWDESLP
jgi:hypothetical protein